MNMNMNDPKVAMNQYDRIQTVMSSTNVDLCVCNSQGSFMTIGFTCLYRTEGSDLP